jgi:hypothetical protein
MKGYYSTADAKYSLMEIYTNLDSEHEGPQWWAEVVNDKEETIYSTTWFHTEQEAIQEAEKWKLNTQAINTARSI